MREVLYRGIPKDNFDGYAFKNIWKDNCDGSFVYGSLLISKDRYYICVSALCKINCCINNGMTSMIEVIPESISQFTGLTDKNGKKIFEGDICSSKEMTYQIIWLDDKYGWFCKVLKSNSCLIDTTMAFPLYQYDNRPENGYRQLEIIGSIHDNPELMKGGAE